MPVLFKEPKDLIKLLATSEADFQKWKDVWQVNNWLLYSDYRNGVYEALALIHGRVVAMQYHEKSEDGEEATQD